VLSQLRRMCKGNNAGYAPNTGSIQERERGVVSEILYLFALTINPKKVILERRLFLSRESVMSDEKLVALRHSHTLHPHADQVRDPLFTSGSPFFDPRDLVQVKYELLRRVRVRVDGDSVSHATSLFAISRPTFYAAQSAWQHSGIIGLLPQPTGPRHAHKLTEDIIAQLEPLAKTMSPAELAVWLHEQQHLTVHPRSIERALARSAKKGG
jgi:transposase